tara:strand:+ start:216 stop:530 length:315 start_codon:yes stop_codon:yes gene_type:complete
MSYNPTFAISFINTETGNGIIDAGTSDLKTAKGAARNWYKNVGHVVTNWTHTSPTSMDEVKVIVRPIESADDSISIPVERIQANKYINREERNGATILSMDDLF